MSRQSEIYKFILLGAMLAAGAPLGWLLLRWRTAAVQGTSPGRWAAGELLDSADLYAYLWGATTLAFSLFGGWVGWLYDRLYDRYSNLDHVNQDVRILSLTDSLTGMGNYRGLMLRFQEELGYPLQNSKALSLIMIDLDHLKQINDERGHLAGDVALQRIAHAIQGALRAGDYPARYGGDEFAILLPATHSRHAQQVAQRIHEGIRTQGQEQNGLTVSIGVTTALISRDLAPQDVLAQADAALYASKMSGRNQTCVYRPKGSKKVRFQPARRGG